MDTAARKESLAEFWRWHLMNEVLPFYLRHAVDAVHGGYTTCLDNDGTMLSGDKYTWSQGRGVWTFSAVYNRIDHAARFLEAAKSGAEFLRNVGSDEHGQWPFRTDRQGKVLEGPISIYADMFVVYGLTEYYRGSADVSALKLAYKTLNDAHARASRADFNAVAPYHIPKGWRAHGVPMIFVETAQELARSIADPALDEKVDRAAETILQLHYKPHYGVILENVTLDGGEIDQPEGRIVNPGHTIESAWFLIHWAKRRGNDAVVSLGCELIRKALELGWDREFGGIYHGMDHQTGSPSPVFANAECKLWWPHTEALYALILIYELTGENWALDWYGKVHDWSMKHHRSPWGDWYQRLDRQGRPITKVVALPVKDPYHLPRALILAYQSLRRMLGKKARHDPFDDLEKVPVSELS